MIIKGGSKLAVCVRQAREVCPLFDAMERVLLNPAEAVDGETMDPLVATVIAGHEFPFTMNVATDYAHLLSAVVALRIKLSREPTTDEVLASFSDDEVRPYIEVLCGSSKLAYDAILSDEVAAPKLSYQEKCRLPQWQKRRLEILSRDAFTCTKCAATTKQLHVHHRYYERGRDPWDYPDDALATLCEDCHKAEHA